MTWPFLAGIGLGVTMTLLLEAIAIFILLKMGMSRLRHAARDERPKYKPRPLRFSIPKQEDNPEPPAH